MYSACVHIGNCVCAIVAPAAAGQFEREDYVVVLVNLVGIDVISPDLIFSVDKIHILLMCILVLPCAGRVYSAVSTIVDMAVRRDVNIGIGYIVALEMHIYGCLARNRGAVYQCISVGVIGLDLRIIAGDSPVVIVEFTFCIGQVLRLGKASTLEDYLRAFDRFVPVESVFPGGILLTVFVDVLALERYRNTGPRRHLVISVPYVSAEVHHVLAALVVDIDRVLNPLGYGNHRLRIGCVFCRTGGAVDSTCYI